MELQINGCILDSEPTATHLGVLQGAARTINTQRIGTRTMYALFGAGLYGRMVSTPWCRPRYGPLTSAHGCYTVQSSGASTTQTQTFWRMGMFPIEAEIDRKSLTFFRNIIKDKNSLEFDICERQLAVKGSKSRSWLIYITALLTKYNLPAPEHMLY